jgi:glycosyltransferase involved in cell wall biosynthesis
MSLDTDTRIAVVSSTCLEVPPSGYGGLELMVYNLCHELGQRGYDVTCIAPQGTDIENVDTIETTRPSDAEQCFRKEPQAYEMYADRLAQFDLVFDHSWQKLSYRRTWAHGDEMDGTAIVGIWHGMPRHRPKPVERPNFCSVSRTAARAWSGTLGFEVRHVYNGIDLERYPLVAEKGDYVMTLNRIMPEKGILQCIDLAEHLELQLEVVGEDQFVDDLEYVVEVMRRCGQSEYATYVGQVDHDEKVDLLQRARALVLLPQPPYQEAFGLAAAEAMAAGTPVLATDNTGLGEVVDAVQGRGTYDNLEVLAADLDRVSDGSNGFPGPADLRAGVEDNFSIEQMADTYLQRGGEAIEEGW